jgi:flagella basal body P-ring formation protein FlgA
MNLPHIKSLSLAAHALLLLYRHQKIVTKTRVEYGSKNMHHIKHRSRIAKQWRILVILCAFLVATKISATETQSSASIKQTVIQAISEHLSAIYGAEKVANDISIHVANLDSRLALPLCPDPLDAELQQSRLTSQNVSVKVKCPTGKRWSIYAPARLEIFEAVAVSLRNIRAGEVIDAKDYTFSRSNVALLSNQYLTRSAELNNKIAKRSIRSGAVIRLSDLNEPLLVRKGETVALYAQKGALQVTTKGKALSSGQLGQSVRVQNLKSKRVIDAKVVAAGTTEAFSW